MINLSVLIVHASNTIITEIAHGQKQFTWSVGMVNSHYLGSVAHVFVHTDSSFLPARRYASAGNSDRNVSVRLSVRLSVRHVPVLCQNEES